MAVGEPPAGTAAKAVTRRARARRPRRRHEVRPPRHPQRARAVERPRDDGRVAVAGVAKRLLSEFGITILSHVTEIGGVRIGALEVPEEELRRRAEASEVRCADPEAERRMIEAIDQAKAAGDTLGGVFEVVALGCPVAWAPTSSGTASSTDDWPALLLHSRDQGRRDRPRLRGGAPPRLASPRRDPLRRRQRLPPPVEQRGGLEGGVTTASRDRARRHEAHLHPPEAAPLRGHGDQGGGGGGVERSDVCAVPAAGVVGEAMMAIVLAEAFLEKFAGDGIDEVRRNYQGYLDYLKTW